MADLRIPRIFEIILGIHFWCRILDMQITIYTTF